MITEKNIELMIKLLNLSSSENDFEALVAIKKANQLLKSLNLSWAEFTNPLLQSKKTIIESDNESESVVTLQYILEILDEYDLNEWEQKFVSSLGLMSSLSRLTNKQYRKLEAMFESYTGSDFANYF